jgi:Ca-activated chloride channel family protein
MTFAWPWMLLGLLAVPLLVREYRRGEQRRADRRAALADLGLAAPPPEQRRLVPLLMLAALTLLLIAPARPAATLATARREGTVVLAFDVSGSMAATDLAPSRIEAAKAAARRFIARQATTVKLGVVAFAESALVLQRPTTDRPAVLDAVDRLRPRGGTSLGRGLQTSLSLITGRQVPVDAAEGSVESRGPDLGYFGSAAVIVLSDGENTARPDPLTTAEIASSAGVKVYTVGLGRPRGTVLEIDGFQVATSLDETLLRRIATLTNGRYFAAAEARELTRVYDAIDPVWTIAPRRFEVTGPLAGLAGLLLVAGAAVTMVRHRRVI